MPEKSRPCQTSCHYKPNFNLPRSRQAVLSFLWSSILIQYTEQIKEDGTKLKIHLPITYQSGTFQASQKNWSTLTKEAYAIYMSLCKMVSFLKEAQVMVRYDHAPLQKCIYSITKNNKVNNWSQEIHAITPILISNISRGKKMSLWTVLSRLRCLGVYEDNDPKKSGYEYEKSIFDTDENTVHSIDSNQNKNNEFKSNDIKYCLNEKDLTILQYQGTYTHTGNMSSLLHMYNLYPAKIKHLQWQDLHISK